MNNYLIIIFIFALFIIACSEEQLVISNTPPDLPNQNYQLNFQSDSGDNLDSVTISWNQTNGQVHLTDSNTPVTTTGNSHTFNEMIPGEFKNISLRVVVYEDEDRVLLDSVYSEESIQIFTRTVYPVLNFKFEIEEVTRKNGVYDEGEAFTDADSNDVWNSGEDFIDRLEKNHHRKLTWSPTNESTSRFQKYTIFRSNNALQLVNLETCNCKIDILSLLSDSTYIDSSSEVIDNSYPKAFYYSIQVSTVNFTRNSFIYNYTFDELGSIQLTEANVSTNKNKFIEIIWEPIPITDSDYFYQYEIWRASNEEFSDKTLITIITDSNQGKFMDRDVGNGITWYYSVVVVDISGGEFSSDIVSGWSIP